MEINKDTFENIDIKPDFQPMKTGEAKSWLGNYFWVSLPITEQNYQNDNLSPAIEWCKQNFGKSGSVWFEKGAKFYFQKQENHQIFIDQYVSTLNENK